MGSNENSADLLVHPPTPAITFATDAAAQSVIGPLKEQYEKAAAFAYTEWRKADECDADMAAWRKEIAERDRWIQQRGLARQQHNLHAQQAVDVANPIAEMLGAAGVQAPQVVRPLPSVDPAHAEHGVSREAHAAQFGGPLSFADDSPHGPCLNCGKPAWRKPVSPHHPQGATHSFGATCDPEAEEPTYADLGTREPLGFREAALQHPYVVDPTPTGAHPLAQPEERPR